MIKILLADDEEITLKSLIRNIDWNNLHLQLVGCASNGTEALQQIKEKSPDILITDIAMPIMSGLELAQYIHEYQLPVKVVLISGHQDFKYAQQGYQYNVTNYIVKPCDKRQVNELLKTLASKCIHEKKEILEKQHFESVISNSKPLLREKLLLDLIHGTYISPEVLVEKCSFLDIAYNTHYYTIIAEIDDINTNFHPLQEKQKYFISLYMTEALSNVVSSIPNAISISIAEGRYVLIIPENVSKDTVSICTAIRDSFYNYTNLSTTFGIGGPAVPLSGLNEAYTKAAETLVYKYLVGKNAIICYEDIIITTTHEKQVVNILAQQEQIIRAVRSGNSEPLETMCERLFNTLTNCTPTLVKSLLVQLMGNLSAELLSIGLSLTTLFGNENIVIEKLLRYETILDVKLWLQQILQYICEYIKENAKKSSHHLAQKAAQYIDTHYMENLNVDNIADVVHLSAGYLMTIFKKELGISINSYLISKRMERAKELLLEDNLKIYEIAHEVGYTNTTFFSSTFRNQTGLSPKQYKAQYIGNLSSDTEP